MNHLHFSLIYLVTGILTLTVSANFGNILVQYLTLGFGVLCFMLSMIYLGKYKKEREQKA